MFNNQLNQFNNQNYTSSKKQYSYSKISERNGFNPNDKEEEISEVTNINQIDYNTRSNSPIEKYIINDFNISSIYNEHYTESKTIESNILSVK